MFGGVSAFLFKGVVKFFASWFFGVEFSVLFVDSKVFLKFCEFVKCVFEGSLFEGFGEWKDVSSEISADLRVC